MDPMGYVVIFQGIQRTALKSPSATMHDMNVELLGASPGNSLTLMVGTTGQNPS